MEKQVGGKKNARGVVDASGVFGIDQLVKIKSLQP
jgi:hypothetical protein